MPNGGREGRPETTPVLLAWGTPGRENPHTLGGSVAFWLTGGAGLLLWTAVALWLTA